MAQMVVRPRPIAPFHGGCQDHWRLTSDADLVSEGSARLHRACCCFDRSYGARLRGDVFAKFARRLPGNLAKGQSKGAVKGVAESQCDIRDRIRSIRQQHLRPLHAPLKKMSLRWNSKGLLEGSTEMMLAQPSEPSKRDERYSLV